MLNFANSEQKGECVFLVFHTEWTLRVVEKDLLYQVFNRPLVLVDLPQSLIISLHLVDILSQVLDNKRHTQTRTHSVGLVQSVVKYARTHLFVKPRKNKILMFCTVRLVCTFWETS